MVRQQIVDLAVSLRWKPCEDVLHVGIRVIPIDLGVLDQARQCSGTLTGPQRPCKKPIVSAQCGRADLVLAPIVVYRNLPVIQVVRQRNPALEAVIQCFCRRRAVGDFASLYKQLRVQCIGNRLGPFLSSPLAILGAVLQARRSRCESLEDGCRPEGKALAADMGQVTVMTRLPLRTSTLISRSTGTSGFVRGGNAMNDGTLWFVLPAGVAPVPTPLSSWLTGFGRLFEPSVQHVGVHAIGAGDRRNGCARCIASRQLFGLGPGRICALGTSYCVPRGF
jgi:hypothetical protein